MQQPKQCNDLTLNRLNVQEGGRTQVLEGQLSVQTDVDNTVDDVNGVQSVFVATLTVPDDGSFTTQLFNGRTLHSAVNLSQVLLTEREPDSGEGLQTASYVASGWFRTLGFASFAYASDGALVKPPESDAFASGAFTVWGRRGSSLKVTLSGDAVDLHVVDAAGRGTTLHETRAELDEELAR